MDRGRRVTHGNRNPHNRREFFNRSCGNPTLDGRTKGTQIFKPQASAWKALRMQLEKLTSEKAQSLSDLQKAEEDTMKSHNARHAELLSRERDSIREKAKEREALQVKEEKFRLEQKEKLELGEEMKPDNQNEMSKISEEFLEKEEALRLEKDSILESFLVLETQFTTQEKKLTKEILEEREQLANNKSEVLEAFATRERNLDLEIETFCQDVEKQLSEAEKKFRLDLANSVAIRNKMEREIHQRDQTIQHLHSYISELEERSQLQVGQIQLMESELIYQKSELIQQLENNKSCIIAKAKADAVAEYLRGDWQPFETFDASPFNYDSSTDASTQDSAGPFPPNVPYPAQEGFQPRSPCFQIPKQSNGAVLTDLRDRYEDLKVKANAEDNHGKLNWTMTMIRKIVSYYESIGMRVYEESSANKYTSTLIWCPNDHLYPNKLEASFAMGQGDSEEEATENAAQLAFFNIQCFATANIADGVFVDTTIPINPLLKNFNEPPLQMSDIITEINVPEVDSNITVPPNGTVDDDDECRNKNDLIIPNVDSMSEDELSYSLELSKTGLSTSKDLKETPIIKELELANDSTRLI